MLINGEQVLSAYQTIRDFVVFTNKRVISVNVQGMTGKKKDYTSLPYSKISAFSVETLGVFDLDSELEMYFSGLGKMYSPHETLLHKPQFSPKSLPLTKSPRLLQQFHKKFLYLFAKTALKN